MLTACAALVLGIAGGAWARSVELSGYQVEPGDTLYSIAAHELGSGTRWVEISKLNGLGDGSGIRPGEILRLPASRRGTLLSKTFQAAPPVADRVGQAVAHEVRVGHGYTASPSLAMAGRERTAASLIRTHHERRYGRLERSIEIVPRGHVVMVLPAPVVQERRVRHARRVDGAELPASQDGTRQSIWRLVDGMAFLVGAGGTFVFLSRGMKRLLIKLVTDPAGRPISR